MINNGGWIRVGDPSPAKGGEWIHLAGVYDGEDTLSLFVNGEQVASRSGVASPPTNDIDLRLGSYSGSSGGIDGMLDEIAIFTVALEAEDIKLIGEKGLGKVLTGVALASTERPESEATDVARDVVLNWSPGDFAVTHDVHFGTSLDDVNNASRADSMGVLLSQGQTATGYDPAGLLDFGATYYWRVDEVNGAPDYAIYKGKIWSFTVEPFAYAIEDVIATASGDSSAAEGPENTVNGSGLNTNNEHSTEATDMWLVRPGTDPLWIQYKFDRLYRLHEMLVWNYNGVFELLLGIGVKDVTIEYSADGSDWTVLDDVEIAQATARTDYAPNTTADFEGVAARYVRLQVKSGHGLMGQFGLSEVRFTYIPTAARYPEPADGDTSVALDTVLSWRPGREVASHEVYFGTESSNLVLLAATSDRPLIPETLEFGTTYYWKVDEVNDAKVPSLWEGTVWSFATQEFAVIDDMESYDDDENRIYDTWLDGWVNETGSTVGYLEEPFAEKSVVHSGRQSMPLQYDNSAAPFYSEAEFDLGGMDLDTNGANTLRIFVAGEALMEPLFVALEDTAGSVALVMYPAPDTLNSSSWQPWLISYDDLSGINLNSVRTMYIGVGDWNNPASGDAGIVFVDDIGFGKLATVE